jgi:RND family efflux transporter MFP subunit
MILKINILTMKTPFFYQTFQKIKTYAAAHKAISAVVILIIVIGGYYSYKKMTGASTSPHYVIGVAAKGSIISSVSASGQVSALDQLDIKPKVSGELWWVGAKPGDKVAAGAALMSIDNTDAQKAVTDAEQSLETAKLQFQKDQTQAPIDYQNSLSNLAAAKDNLTMAYTDTYNTISSAYLDLPPVMTGGNNILYGYDLSQSRTLWNVDVLVNLFTDTDQSNDHTVAELFAKKAKDDYQIANSKYNASLLAYQKSSRYSSPADLETLLSGTTDMSIAIAQALQSEINFLSEIGNLAQNHNMTLSSVVTTMQTNAHNYLNTANNTLSALLTQKKSLDSAKQTVTTSEQNITLLQVGNPNGSNPISLQISAHNIQSQEYNLTQLKNNLADYTITAPFAGTVAAVPVNVGDTVGTGTTVATLITNQKIATLSLNEVDAAKIKVGDKATLTFDAIDGLSLTGSVAEIDTLGTVSQGVVSYSIKIGFDTQDARIKPGMTVNAAIITDVRQDVLVVPSSAIKTQSGTSYVQVFNPPLAQTGGSQGVVTAETPQEVAVQTGLSDDTNTEITSGLTEGEQIIVRTITTAANTASTQTAPSLFGGGGVRTTTGGGAARMLRGN